MLKQIATSLFASSPSGTLRTDTYAAIDTAKNWLNSDQPGDGMSLNAILKLVAQHTTVPSSTGSIRASPAAASPQAKEGESVSTAPPKAPEVGAKSSGLSFMHVAIPAEEIPVTIGGVTNLVLALGRADGMAGVLAARAWVDTLASTNNKQRSDEWRRAILAGINQMADMSLLTSEFGPRLQMISILKSVAASLYGRGSEQARQSDALWSTKVV
ncbi:hypothetical protein AURDEDRAFT_180057 [Auricularia subglabra TFB-10046 SS5]|nr:hypothetical protein AURDEDRAFT_180057 [Auricularia subglabra TFB-10046 SS5]